MWKILLTQREIINGSHSELCTLLKWDRYPQKFIKTIEENIQGGGSFLERMCICSCNSQILIYGGPQVSRQKLLSHGKAYFSWQNSWQYLLSNGKSYP